MSQQKLEQKRAEAQRLINSVEEPLRPFIDAIINASEDEIAQHCAARASHFLLRSGALKAFAKHVEVGTLAAAALAVGVTMQNLSEDLGIERTKLFRALKGSPVKAVRDAYNLGFDIRELEVSTMEAVNGFISIDIDIDHLDTTLFRQGAAA